MHFILIHFIHHRKQLRILRKLTLYLLNYEDRDIFGEQITNASQIANNKDSAASCVYQPNCQNADAF